ADLPGHRRNRRPLGAVLALVIQDHPHRPFTHLGCVPRQFVAHGSILSRFGASGKGGAIQTGANRAPGQATGWSTATFTTTCSSIASGMAIRPNCAITPGG